MLQLATLALLAAAAFPVHAESDRIHHALQRLYNFDFPNTHRILNEHIAGAPADPVGYGFRGSAYLFYELDRLLILESDFFADDRRIADKKKLKPDAQVRASFYRAVGDARSRAESRLASDPGDRQALFALCVAAGLETDYAALVEKRQLGSLSYARQSHNYALRLLKLDPTFYDAYLTTGLTEYLLGSLPFFVRWFVRFEQAEGSKALAVANLEQVARSGRYFGPFAKILLAVIHLREKRPRQAQELLRELTQAYPENPLLRREYEKISVRIGPR